MDRTSRFEVSFRSLTIMAPFLGFLFSLNVAGQIWEYQAKPNPKASAHQLFNLSYPHRHMQHTAIVKKESLSLIFIYSFIGCGHHWLGHHLLPIPEGN